MSIPTLTDPALSATNDASVVEQNDRNIANAINDLDNTTNVVQFKGLRVYGGTGFLTRTQPLEGNYPNYITGRTVNYFIFWNQHPDSSDAAYLDMSAYAIRGKNLSGEQPDTITVTLQKSSSVTGGFSSVGSLTLDSADAGGLSLIKTVNLSGTAYSTSTPFHRVKVEASDAADDGSFGWGNSPVFVVVNVRMKSASS